MLLKLNIELIVFSILKILALDLKIAKISLLMILSFLRCLMSLAYTENWTDHFVICFRYFSA